MPLNLNRLFVYGSLKRGTDHPMHKRMLRFCSFLEPARMKGYLYQLEGYPGAVQTGDDQWIQGELYRIEQAVGLFDLLDGYEECSKAFEPPHEYTREAVEVITESGQQLRAWVYLYNFSITGRQRIASGCY